jgi:ATP-dependent Clp protease ATP-binding subunit ClpC
MQTFLWSLSVGVLIGASACFLLMRARAGRGRLVSPSHGGTTTSGRPDATAGGAVGVSVEGAPAVAGNSDAADGSVPESIEAVLRSVAQALSSPAEDIGHPRELPDLPEFRAAVEALSRPEASALRADYALGSHWSMACAAYACLSSQPDRQRLRDRTLASLPEVRPYVVLYALRYLASLQQRPPVGAVILRAPPWWATHPLIATFLQEYFSRCAESGDWADFGEDLHQREQVDAATIETLLKRVDHAFAADLLMDLHDWQAKRVDREFLGTIGTVLDSGERDPKLVLPDTWKDRFASACAYIGQVRPRSVLVCGDPGVGKSAFVALLCEALQDAGWTIFAAAGNELMADQMYIGQLEGRLRKLVDALHARRRIVWRVGDLIRMAYGGMHSGQPASLLDQILPEIATGQLIVIGEASQAAATRLFQHRPTLRSLMEVVTLPAMDEPAAARLAEQVGERNAARGGPAVSTATIAAGIDLARHYLSDGQLPGALLQLLDRSAQRAAAAGDAIVSREHVVSTLSQLSGLPEVILDSGARVDLAEIRRFFTSRVIGQEEAVSAMVDRIAMLKAGLTDLGRPIGVFLLAGPTGTGKTELAKTLAEFLFGSPERMTRLDMSEFQTSDSLSKIVGERGNGDAESLVGRIRRQPFSVVLLDEFEKAHPGCWDLFLQIFDDGRLSDANGNEAGFRHCIIVLTSNLGATTHRSGGLGFRSDGGTFADDQVLRTIGQTFRPEFVNRLDRVIVFKPLSRDLMRGILRKELARVEERRGLRERSWAIEWEASAIEFLLDRGFSPEMGARPLKRAIDQLLLAPLAATLVEHRFPRGDQFLFVRSNGKAIEVEFVDPDAEPADATAPEPQVDEALSLPSIVLRQTGSASESATLAACWRETADELESESWRARIDEWRMALSDPDIWGRDDRHVVFSRLELADRIEEAARTTERLFQRYQNARGATARASRELAARLAQHLHNLRQGMEDLAGDAPVDTLVRVEPTHDLSSAGDDASVWCRKLVDMYRAWANKRRMQLREIPSGVPGQVPILLITGFGACRIMAAEAGLHVLEDEVGNDGPRRIVARVLAVPGPDRGSPAAGEYAAATRRLAADAPSTTIVRRYRTQPSPLVRDMLRGWRTGRYDTVIGGDFDLIGAVR